MVNLADDISVVLSGGATNTNPNLALGGQPSSAPVTNDVLNNLYDDISPEESDDGHEDYRCIYYFNDGEYPVYDIELWVDDFVGGPTVQIGSVFNTEVQKITLSGALATGGYITINYDGNEFNSSMTDLASWATNIQTSLNSLASLRDVEVQGRVAGTTTTFEIHFNDRDGKRNHPKIIVTDHLSPSGITTSVSVTTEGSPINVIASEIGVETTPPGGVGFSEASEQSPLTIPRLEPAEGFPLWIKRSIVAGTEPKERDGFYLKFSAQTLEPA